jgi:hypothetical protein
MDKKIVDAIQRHLTYKAYNDRLGGDPSGMEHRIAINLETIPNRVYVAHTTDKEQATTPERAAIHYQVIPDFILIRRDGWTLGVTKDCLAVGLAMWQDEFVAMLMLEQSTRIGDKMQIRLCELDTAAVSI